MTESEDLSLNFNRGEISIPLTQGSFRDFISSVLSRPNVLEGIKHGFFVVDKEFIIQLDQALTHRVTSQNNLLYSDSSIKVHYEDETSEEFSSLVQFEHERCKRHILCKGFTCVWKFTIQFEQNSPQIQTIILSALTEITKRYPYEEAIIDYDPAIRYSIQFTDRTWAREIERIIAQELIPQAIRKRRRIEALMLYVANRRIPDTLESIGSLATLSFFIYLGYKLITNNSNTANSQKISFEEFSAIVDGFRSESVSVSDKLDFIIRLLKPVSVATKVPENQNLSAGDSVWKIITEISTFSIVIIYFLVSGWLLIKTFNESLPENKLYVLFNEKTIDDYNKFEDRIKTKQELFRWFFVLFLSSIPIGILINFMSDILW